MGKPHAERQQEIIEAALSLAAEQGVQRVTTQAIADRVGIAQPTVFRHFRSRDAIFAAAIDWLAGRMLQALQPCLDADAPADERLRRLLATQLDFITRHRGLPRVLFSDRLHLESPILKTAVQQVMQRYTGQIAGLLAEGIEEGCFRADLDTAAAARHIAALLQGLIMRWSIFDFEFALEKEAMPLWDFVHPALRAP
ncbi:TetR/AcrR family transcriptional regulator [Thiohalobacter sp. IOR34]|uniref:TetR/AcrR family transcriptional regulator n=1 Tax=Thiohalobacter sp. IOR34 TaxID=3057176 RepID=UPI0025B050A9|nr:TetR/AcrR family transcriptional regulator [Thiohalobacter sp. IOR34]WJW76387.1 TetR/AcrR family transcriptional regulator [Thiohalobacter sp. IOR34]